MLSPQRLRQRAVFVQQIRAFFQAHDYLEVETPIRLPFSIPEANIRAIQSEGAWLQTSPELCMKLLLAAGNERLFQICRCFRGEEVGRLHLSEFSMLEWYQVGWDYQDLMQSCEAFIRSLLPWALACQESEDSRQLAQASAVKTGDCLQYQNRSLYFPATLWPRLTVEAAFTRYASISLAEALATDRFDECLVVEIEPNLGWAAPVFLMDYPAEFAALSRKKTTDPSVAERFELYIGGIELANGFSELIDPGEQRARFEESLAEMAAQGQKVAAMPERFLTALGAMKETAGIALGLDRLFMLLADLPHIEAAVSLSPPDFLAPHPGLP